MASSTQISPPITTGAFGTAAARRRYWVALAIALAVGLCCAAGLLLYDNPAPVDDPRFAIVARRRVFFVFTMLIVAVAHAVATVAFQTVTSNRIITPSIMGFEALYTLINTATVYALGVTGLVAANHLGTFVFQLLLMVVLSLVLYGWLLTGERGDLHVMLLVGIIIGGGMASISTFLQRMLTPSEFDVLQARLFGSVNNASRDEIPVAAVLVVVGTLGIALLAKRLNVLSLGREHAINLGINHRAMTIGTLVLVSVLMAASTALVGPMTFLGFLVATLAYQFADTYDHRYILPLAVALGFAVLSAAYFLIYHVLPGAGAVSIIIEIVGGGMFLIVILRKGRL